MKGLENLVEEINGNSLEIKKDDPLSRGISYVGCLPTKLIFLSDKMGKYPEKETQDYVKSYLSKAEFKGVKVRIGHSRVLKDTYRLFTDKNLKDISLAGRIFLGIPSTLIKGLYAKLTRSDHYNSFTKTAMIYSDIPAIALHELGHAEDFSKRKNPTMYSLMRMIPFFNLYQEYIASRKAHKNLEEKDKRQTGRYLVPAFATYVAAAPLALPFLPIVAAGYLIGGLHSLYRKSVDKIKESFKKKSAKQ